MVSTPTQFHKNAGQAPELAGSKCPRAPWIIPALLLVIYVGECAWFIRTQSFTFDEPVHITAGLEAWREGRFARWNDHPPLQRLLCTLPLLPTKYRITVEGEPDAYRVTAIEPNPQELAWRGRAVSVALGIILGLLLWFSARSLYSTGAANFVLTLFVLSPAAIAHFSLITTDGAGTLMIFATAVQLVRWRRNPSRSQTVLLGVTLGLLLLAKFYTPPMFLIAVAWMLVLKGEGVSLNPRQWNWRETGAAVLIAFLLLWAGYFFHVSHVRIQDGEMVITFPHRDGPIVKKVHSPVNISLPVPAGEYLEGLRTVAFHNHRGHRSYFLGIVSEKGGWKSYYPVVMMLKWPTIVLGLLVAAVIAAARRRRLALNSFVIASFPLVFMVFAVFSKIDIGDRHILPLYPFALLFCGVVWKAVICRRALVLSLVFLLLIDAADGLRYAPGYISYFNLFVKQDQGYKLLSDSNVDWGQGLLALRSYQDRHPNQEIHLAYWGSTDPVLYGIHASPLGPGQRQSGTVIISATMLTGQYLPDPTSYHWLLLYRPERSLDHSMFLFEIK